MSIKRWIPVLLVAGLVGCGGPVLAGSAATVGDARLTDAQLADTTSELSAALGIPQNPQVSQAVLSRWMVQELVAQLAQSKGFEVTNGEVDEVIAQESETAGGREQLEQGALQAGLLPDMIPDAIRTTLLINKMSEFTVTGDDPSGQAGLVVQVQQFSEEADAEVSPRYGTWDPEQLTVGALPTDLSSPAIGDVGIQPLPNQQ